MTTLKEYDLEFNPSIIVKVQGFSKLVTKSMDSENQLEEGW
jgi:hypothetical protein